MIFNSLTPLSVRAIASLISISIVLERNLPLIEGIRQYEQLLSQPSEIFKYALCFNVSLNLFCEYKSECGKIRDSLFLIAFSNLCIEFIPIIISISGYFLSNFSFSL